MRSLLGSSSPASSTDFSPPSARVDAVTAVAVLASICLSGCGGEPADPESVTRRDSAGVTVVESRAPAWSEGQGWAVEDTPEVEIGAGVDAGVRPVQQLSDVSGVLVLDDGRIVVANGGDNSLRFYGPEGEFLRSAAGEGEGPGEIGGFRPGGLVLLGVDTLATLDGADGALELYSTGAAHLDAIELASTGDPVRPLRMYGVGGRLSDGSLLLLPDAFPASMRPEPTTYWDAVPNLTYRMDGSLRDTLARPSGMMIHATPRRAGNVPFGMSTSAAVAGGRLYKGRGEDFSVRVYGPGGLGRIVRRPGFERGIVADTLRSRMTEVTGKPVPELRPAYSGIAVGPDGHLWVEHHLTYRERGPATWSVFGPEGRWLGDVRVPVNLDEVVLTDDGIAGMTRDAVGVERVQLYRVDRGR